MFKILKDFIRAVLAAFNALGTVLMNLGEKDARCLGMLFGVGALLLLIAVFSRASKK